MRSVILIPLSSYNSLTLSSNQKLSVMTRSTVESKLASRGIRDSSVPATLLLSFEYFLLSWGSVIRLPSEKARSAGHSGCSSLADSEILGRSPLPM